jgi:hypothetical protein
MLANFNTLSNVGNDWTMSAGCDSSCSGNPDSGCGNFLHCDAVWLYTCMSLIQRLQACVFW